MTDETAEDWFELGKYHSSLNNSRNAIKCYNKCIEKNSNHYKAWSNMAAEFFQLKLYKKSIECCKKAIKIEQLEKNSWLTLAANYFQLNEDGRARFCFDKAIELGSIKAKRFIEKVKSLNDKMLDTAIIDVSSEILKEEKLIFSKNEEIMEKELIKKEYIPKIPTLNDKDYNEKLGGFLLEIGNRSIIESGGILSFLELYSIIKKNYPNFDGKPSHIIKALKRLERNNLIEGMKQLDDSNMMIIEFVPSELTSDIKIIIEIASKKDSLDYDDIMSITSWDNYRIKRIMTFLEKKGIAKKIKSNKEGVKWNLDKDLFSKTENTIGEKIDDLLAGYKDWESSEEGKK